MKSAVQFLIALFIVLTMVIPTGLAAADESFIVFTGDREEYKYSDPLYVRNNGENRVAYCYNASKKVPPTWQEGGQTVYTVSYTHLDVYKRQAVWYGDWSAFRSTVC